MLRFKKLCILHPFIMILNLWLTTSTTLCDELKFYTPLSPINQMIICKSENPYHRCETLNMSHTSCSSSLNYASPKLLSAYFTSPSNSILLYNCLNSKLPLSPLPHTLTCLHTSGASSTARLLVDDLTKLDMEFNPSDFNCSYYGRVYRKSAHENHEELGTKIALEVPDHIPNICDECQKANGNCGAALRCICHPKECKNKVISKSGSSNSFGYDILSSLLPLLDSVSTGKESLRPRKLLV